MTLSSDDKAVISPGDDRVFDGDGDGWNFERFGDGSGDGFSVTIEDDDIIIEGEQTFEVDLSDPNAQNNSRRSFSSSNDDENGGGE